MVDDNDLMASGLEEIELFHPEHSTLSNNYLEKPAEKDAYNHDLQVEKIIYWCKRNDKHLKNTSLTQKDSKIPLTCSVETQYSS